VFPSITPHDWQQLSTLIDALLDTGADDRPALLDELSAGDAARRAELAQLIEECERPDPLLDGVAADAFAGLLADQGIPVPETLALRYRIVRELGRGGMAVVYLAQDLKHAREVAVKVVRPEVAAALGRERFLREIAIAAQLRHPGIVPLYDSGEADGLLYYVMPFESGSSLRERLAHGPLPVDDAVLVLRDLCDALAHAHQQGIVHRDIKPDNVLLAGRRALITDFGVAKALTEASDVDAAHTAAGITLGTPAYMAPEQIGPDPRADHRADIYALGVLAYELLAGHPPFGGETSQEVLAAHLVEAPLPLAARRPDVPPALARLVMRCLEKRPEDRWQQITELGRGLEDLGEPGTPAAERHARRAWPPWAALATGVIGVALLAVFFWRTDRQPPGAGARDLFLVAEFVNRTGDSTLGPLVAETIRDELAGSPRLASVSQERIAATRRRMRLPAEAPLTSEVARELATREEIGLVVEGTVSAAGPGLALSARIVDVGSGNVVHAATAMARDAADVSAAIQRLSRGLRVGLGEPLAPIQVPTGALWSFTTRSLPALEKQQLSIVSRSQGEYLRALEVNREAVALDPDFATAYLAIASNTALAGLPTGQTIPEVLQAYRLADSLPERERRAVEAFHHWHVTGELTRSVAAFQDHIEAMKATPGEAGFVAEAATALHLNGDPVGAERLVGEVKRVMEQGGATWPAGRSSGGVQLAHVQALHAVGRDAEAASLLASATSRRPDNTRALLFQVGFLADSGRYEAVHALAARLGRQSGLRNDLRVRAESDAVRGRLDEAVGHLRELRDQALSLDQLGAAVEVAAAAARLRRLAGDTAGVAEVDDLLVRHPVDSLDLFARPYLPLALFYAQAGRPREARGWLRRYEREFPLEFQGPDRWMLHRARAAALAAEDEPERALAELREAARRPALRVGLFDDAYVRLSDHPELARLYRRLGRPDSALAVYRRYLAARSLTRIVPDALERGPALEAVGALHEERGERRLAAAAYREFAALWREGDAGLQPRVERARRRAAVLSPN
jgi:tetratricopeptide (TPR) repeat protein